MSAELENVCTPCAKSRDSEPRDYPVTKWMAVCDLCNAAGPSDAHHTKQENHYTTVPLCKDCHQGSLNGWHGQKRMWNVMKMDENDALNAKVSGGGLPPSA